MTDKQFKEYQKLSNEIQPLKSFLYWCGNKYHNDMVSFYQTRIIKKKFCIGRVGAGFMENTEVNLPLILQKRIIDVIEQYVDEKQKELDEI